MATTNHTPHGDIVPRFVQPLDLSPPRTFNDFGSDPTRSITEGSSHALPERGSSAPQDVAGFGDREQLMAVLQDMAARQAHPDPMRAIHAAGYGPPTDATQRGQMHEPTLTNADPKAFLHPVARAALDYGPLPAKIATEIAMQPIHAGQALGDALNDPTLPKMTNAAVQSAMALAKPMHAVKALGAGYGMALADDLGLNPISAATAAGEKKGKPKPLIEVPGLTPGQIDELMRARKDLADENYSRSPRKQLQDTIKRLEGLSSDFTREGNSAKIAADAAKSKAERDEYDRAVANAEQARDKAMARDRRFSDTTTGQVFDATGGFGVAGVGAGIGAVSRLGMKAMGHNGFAGGHGVPIVGGTLAGMTAANAPLYYNGWLTEPDNPEKKAFADYARKLPAGHPEKETSANYAASLPDANPLAVEAQKQFYDGLGSRLLVGAAEGLGGAIPGVEATNAMLAVPKAIGAVAETAGSIPGRVATGYQKAMAKADEAAAKRTKGADKPTGNTSEKSVQYTPAHSASTQSLLGTPLDALAARYEAADAAGKEAILAEISNLTKDRAALGSQFRAQGLDIPSDRSLASRAGSTNKAARELHEAGVNPADPANRAAILGGKGQLAVPLAVGAGAGPAVQNDPDAPSKFMWAY